MQKTGEPMWFSGFAVEFSLKLLSELWKADPDIEVFEGRIASGDQFVADQGVKDFVVKEFGAYAVEMEGAAIAQAAYLNNVPFLVIRAISDKADGSAEMDYPTFEAMAAEHSFKLTLRILKDIQG